MAIVHRVRHWPVSRGGGWLEDRWTTPGGLRRLEGLRQRGGTVARGSSRRGRSLTHEPGPHPRPPTLTRDSDSVYYSLQTVWPSDPARWTVGKGENLHLRDSEDSRVPTTLLLILFAHFVSRVPRHTGGVSRLQHWEWRRRRGAVRTDTTEGYPQEDPKGFVLHSTSCCDRVRPSLRVVSAQDVPVRVALTGRDRQFHSPSTETRPVNGPHATGAP